jgi:hypothetical protein
MDAEKRLLEEQNAQLQGQVIRLQETLSMALFKAIEPHFSGHAPRPARLLADGRAEFLGGDGFIRIVEQVAIPDLGPYCQLIARDDGGEAFVSLSPEYADAVANALRTFSECARKQLLKARYTLASQPQ